MFSLINYFLENNMNKEKLQERLAIIERNITQTRAQVEQMMATYNMLLGRKDELLMLINDADYHNVEVIKQDNIEVVDSA
jgi:hypothetical protein